jgi:hypothetical protein
VDHDPKSPAEVTRGCDVVRETLVNTVDKVVDIYTNYIQVVSIEMEELRYFSTRGGDERLTFEEVSKPSQFRLFLVQARCCLTRVQAS